MKNRVSYLLAALVLCFSGDALAQAAKSKMKLKVLFVGYDPAKPVPQFKRGYPGMMSKETFIAEYPVRMPAFRELLSQYFTEVQTMDCRDWKAADSDPFDVTVFDFKPTALEESRMETSVDGKQKYIPSRYLQESFSKPVVFIASTASEMGAAIGLKLDWLCLCLDADAHHLNASHTIFKGPLETVSPTMEMRKTPDGVFHYTTGDTVPKNIPMWTVQTLRYNDGASCRIGLVSRGNRFTEGPDAENISSGVCQKDVGAVALGRHGNFFLWGFGCSPAQMTEEAKKVFVNVVAYMKQFDGKKPITRKYNEKMATTDDVKEVVANTSMKSYEMYKEEIEKFNEHNLKEKKRIDEKKAAGTPLTAQEEEALAYIGHQQSIPTWEDFLKQNMGKLASRFGTDALAYQKYMRENAGYMYCDPEENFSFFVDEDVQKIGVPNHSLQLLETCIAMLKKNDRPELALTVLKRYTPEQFTTAAEWSKWFSKNKNKLFFSETNGYRFMINTYN